MKKTVAGLACAAIVWLAFRLVAPLVVQTRIPIIELNTGGDTGTLVVALHGFGGDSRPGLIALAGKAFPGAHLIAPLYNSGILAPFSNCSPYDIADAVECAINEAYNRNLYQRIVLIGHSMGGELLRKVYLWGAGIEDDRPAHFGRHEWVNHVDRFVSLASINRGWSLDPFPENMPWYRRVKFAIGVMVGRLTGTGQMILAVERGSPFVADSRVQWISLARKNEYPKLPLVIHLRGTIDDIATSEDTKDAQAAKDFKFKSLDNTNHADIAAALAEELSPDKQLTARAQTILDCVTLPVNKLNFDEPDALVEERQVLRIVFVLHGIRDYDTWGMKLKDDIDAALGDHSTTRVVVPQYGYFPMAPFLLWNDRQEKVRWFMDLYTELLAKYPCVEKCDFIGHSNGTYILASALERYRTVKANDVVLAGSVVRQAYPWSQVVQQNRVRRVWNIVATSDWVVAIFPRLFEQIAEWFGQANNPNEMLDIGAAGFRGFRESGMPDSGIRNVTFSSGGHSTGVDLAVAEKRDALIRFGQFGLDAEEERVLEGVFSNAGAQCWFWDNLSNVSWLAWLAIVVVLTCVGIRVWRWKRYMLIAYALVLIAVLNSF